MTQVNTKLSGKQGKTLALIGGFFVSGSKINNSLYSFEGQLSTFAWVFSLLGRYFIIVLKENNHVYCVMYSHAHSD